MSSGEERFPRFDEGTEFVRDMRLSCGVWVSWKIVGENSLEGCVMTLK
jgi:hypothetical protein